MMFICKSEQFVGEQRQKLTNHSVDDSRFQVDLQ